MKRVGIIGDGLAPYFNESLANQIRILSEILDAQVITCNDIGLHPFKQMKRYLIINSRFLMNRTPLFSLINGAILYVIIKLYEKKFDIIIVPGGFESEFLKHLNPKKCIPIVTSIPFIDKSIQSKIREHASKIRRIIVQSEKTKNQLISMGIDQNKIILMYPLIDLEKFVYCAPPSLDIFRILFASAPNLELPNENNFRDKGVSLLLETFKDFISENNAELYIAWRGKYNKKLFQKIDELGLKKYVRIINDMVNMPEIYTKVHITVIPFLNLWRSPEIPLSGVESLSCGRPVVTTDVADIANIVKVYECGCVSKPQRADLLNALMKSKRNYQRYQKNCVDVAKKLFGLTEEKIKKIIEITD